MELSRHAHATVFTGLFFRDEVRDYYRDHGLSEPYEQTARRKVFPEGLERRVLAAATPPRVAAMATGLGGDLVEISDRAIIRSGRPSRASPPRAFSCTSATAGVAKLTNEQLRQLCWIRLALEDELVRTSRWPDATGIAHLRALNAPVGVFVTGDLHYDYVGVMRDDREFHFALWELSPLSVLR